MLAVVHALSAFIVRERWVDVNGVVHTGSPSGRYRAAIAEAESLIRPRVADRPEIVAFHPGGGIESSDMPLRDRDVEALVDQGWVIKENSPMAWCLRSGQARPETTPAFQAR